MRHLHTKLIIAFTLLISVTLVVVSVLTYTQQKNQIEPSVRSQAKSIVTGQKVSIELFLEKYSMSINQYSTDDTVIEYLRGVNQNKPQYNEIRNSFKEYLKLNPNSSLIYTASMTKKMLLEPYVQLPADFDPTTRPWYKAALANPKQVAWSEPYLDTASDNITITVSKVVIDPETKEMLGIVALDLNLNKMANTLVHSVDVGHHGYSVLLDNKGVAIVHPTEKGKDLSKLDYIQKIYRAGESNIIDFTSSKGKQILVYDTVGLTGWKIAAVYNNSDLLEGARQVRNSNFLISFISILIVIVAIYFISKLITKPLVLLSEEVNRVAEGDLTVSVNPRTKDEIGQLTEHFNNMVKNMRHIIQAVNLSADNVRESVDHFGAIVEETTASGEEVGRAVAEIAISSTQAAHDVDTTNHKTMELSNQIDQISSLINQLTDYSHTAEIVNENGIAQIDVLKGKAAEADKVSKSIEKVIINLVEKINKIGEVIRSINEISDQTNLLALNASIEAARAGEHGKGFAVVASEVRKLAEQSSNATEQVRQIINEIQQGAQKAVSEVDINKQLSQEQNKVSADTESAFNTIAETINEMNHSIALISNEVADMNQNKDEVVASIQRISAMIEQTAASCEEVSASTEEQHKALSSITRSTEKLIVSSDELTRMVHKFKIGQG